MQKALRFLEANVEWFALGIAVLFMGWTAYAYLITRPVTRDFMGQQVTPGDIDKVIDAGPAQNLRDQMNNAPAVNFPVEDFASAVTRGLQLDSENNLPELAQQPFDWQPFDPGVANENEALAAKVKQLPTLPPAQPLLVATGLDTIVPDLPPGTNPPPNATGKDVILTVAAFTIPWQPLSDQWNKAFGPDKPGAPPKLANADFEILSVVASRTEKLPDGSWGPDQPVPAHISGFPPYPAANNKNGEINYEIAVAKQPELVVAPTIPTEIAGALWKDPLVLWQEQTAAPTQTQTPPQSPESLGAQPDNFRLIEVRGGGSRGQTPARTQQDSAGNPFDVPSTGRPVVPPPPVQAAPPTAAPAAVAPAPGTITPILQLANPGAPPALMPVEPIAKIDPVGMPANSPDLCVYIVDDSAQSGKTYKYRIVYKVLNPLFNKAPQSALEPKWVDQFDLVSPVSQASPEIKVPVKTYLFCATPQGVTRNSQYPFEVITWANGQWRSDIFKVSPGDPIGSMDKDVDYSTGWSYADGQTKEDAYQNERFMVTLLDDDNGSAVIRDASQDANSPNHKEKLGWVAQPKSTAAQPPPVLPPVMPSRFSPYPAGQGYGFGERGVGK